MAKQQISITHCTLAGAEQSARDCAQELYWIWRHLGDADCAEQIEAHMESEGFDQSEIDEQLERLHLDGCGLYVEQILLPA